VPYEGETYTLVQCLDATTIRIKKGKKYKVIFERKEGRKGMWDENTKETIPR
jgi:hypothetical protein